MIILILKTFLLLLALILSDHTMDTVDKLGHGRYVTAGKDNGAYFVFRIQLYNKLYSAPQSYPAHKELQETGFIFYFFLICSEFLEQKKYTHNGGDSGCLSSYCSSASPETHFHSFWWLCFFKGPATVHLKIVMN